MESSEKEMSERREGMDDSQQPVKSVSDSPLVEPEASELASPPAPPPPPLHGPRPSPLPKALSAAVLKAVLPAPCLLTSDPVLPPPCLLTSDPVLPPLCLLTSDPVLPAPSLLTSDPVLPAPCLLTSDPGASPTLEQLGVELKELRGEMELMKSLRGEMEMMKIQHNKEIKQLMNELDEEKMVRLTIQMDMKRMKKHMSKK